jgi:transcriptional regulator with XRE-family HTH domain
VDSGGRAVENLWERLRQIRISKNLKQKDMAQKMGISRSTYSKIESGKVELTVKNLLKIGAIFKDISLEWLLTGEKSTESWEFGKYSEEIGELLTYVAKNKAGMHSILSYFYELKDKKCREKERETLNK